VSQSGVRVRDFGCGELRTVASHDLASVHYFVRDPDYPHRRAEHAYPSHSLVFTDVGEWQYHGPERASTITESVVVAGIGKGEYACAHPRGELNACFVVAIADAAFDSDEVLFPSSVVSLSQEMTAHRRAIVQAVRGEREGYALESLAFSLYDAVSRASAKATRVPATDVRMSYAQKLLRDRATTPVSIAAIARELDLSRFTFTRRFLAATGETPHRFVMRLRIERSKEQLAKSNRAIEDVGLANGFGSIAHFSHAFRAIVGCSPSAFRSTKTT
jgi:AraC-like DNA-binding protein